MKMNLFCKQCMAALPLFAAAFTTSCSDQDFDWDKAYSQNAEYNYEQNFSQVFGAIDPNQDWDFSSGVATEKLAAFTLADGTEINVGDSFSSVSTRAAGDFVNPTTTSDWYYIPANTLSWFKTNWTDGVDHRDMGTPFAMYVPGGQCSITPFFQGNAGDSWYLNIYFEVPIEGTTQVTSYSKTAVWNKGQIIQKGTLGNYQNISHSGGDKVPLGGKDYVVTGPTNGVFTLTSGSEVLTTYSNGDIAVGGNLYNIDVRPDNSTKYRYATYGSWSDVGSGGNTETAAAVRSKTLHFKNIPKGTVVYFGLYNTSTKYDGVNFEALSVADQMRAVTLPEEAIPANYPIDFGESNHPVIIGCEDRRLANSDKDYNDIVFFVNGLIPTETTNNLVPRSVRKRYMVEDMGYSDPSSVAVVNNYTDIDFNDIVVDFEKTENWRVNYKNGVKESESLESTTYKAIVRALGGTWDFKLFVGTNEVFHKEGATQVRKNDAGVIVDSDRGPSKVDFNGNYKIDNVAISSLSAERMYNTARRSDMKGDGNYPATNAEFQTSYICELTSTALSGWNPTANNISFLILDSQASSWNLGSSLDSKTDQGNVYRLNFPAMGAMPKIVAFDVTKPWQKEKVHVNTDWFKADTGSVDGSIDQNIQ